jgi:DNA-directed RNA polymerase sigma subunit (sigma70/sigma32)
MTDDEQLALDLALRGLPDRLRLLVELRFLAERPLTLKQAGQRLGISPQRASPLQTTALWRMRWLLVWEPHALESQPAIRVRSTLPIIKDGNTIGIHVWFDAE